MKEELSYEESMSELEKVVKELESNELTLDESIKRFEKGIELSKNCSQLLESAEKKISILIEKEDGNSKLEDFNVPEE